MAAPCTSAAARVQPPMSVRRPANAHKTAAQPNVGRQQPVPRRRHRHSVAVSATAAPATKAAPPFATVQNEEQLFAILKAGASGGTVS